MLLPTQLCRTGCRPIWRRLDFISPGGYKSFGGDVFGVCGVLFAGDSRPSHYTGIAPPHYDLQWPTFAALFCGTQGDSACAARSLHVGLVAVARLLTISLPRSMWSRKAWWELIYEVGVDRRSLPTDPHGYVPSLAFWEAAEHANRMPLHSVNLAAPSEYTSAFGSRWNSSNGMLCTFS